MSKVKTENLSETMASDTLAPNSNPADGLTKAGMMASMMAHMNGMSKGDMVDFFNKSMAQFGPNVDLGVPDGNAETNLQSVMTKEDVDDMFDGQDLSEEFKTKISTLIESAVNANVSLTISQIQEEQEQLFDQLVEEYKEEISEQLDEYLNYAINEWIETNKLQLENAIKIELHNSFMDGLVNLFKEHYIDIPEEKYDVIGALQDEIAQLKEKMNEVENKNISLASANEELECELIFNQMKKGLTETDAVKFADLIENITYTDLDNFKNKLGIIKESYFSQNTKTTKKTTPTDEAMGISSLNEEVDGKDNTSANVNVDPEVERLARLLSKTARR